MVLYPKKYIGFNLKCLQENNFDNEEVFDQNFFSDMNDLIENIKTCTNVMKYFSVLGLVICPFLCGVLNIDKTDHMFLFYIWSCIALIFYLGMIIPAHISLYKVKQFKNFLLCGSSVTNDKISYFNSSSNTYYYKYLNNCFCCSFAIIIYDYIAFYKSIL